MSITAETIELIKNLQNPAQAGWAWDKARAQLQGRKRSEEDASALKEVFDKTPPPRRHGY